MLSSQIAESFGTVRSSCISKFATAAIIWFALVALVAGSVSAQPAQNPTGYVTDAARVIPLVELNRLEARCARLDQNRRAQIALVTVTALNGEPIEKAALDLFKKWGIGHKGVNDGLLVMLSIRDRQSRITVGYGLEKIVSNDVAASILRSIRPDLSRGSYGTALNRVLDSVESLLPCGRGCPPGSSSSHNQDPY